MSERIKWGVIGSGGIARLRTIPEGIVAAENAELIAVYDVNEEVNREVANKFSTRAVSSIDELLAEDIQAVYIATPAYLHHRQVIVAAQAGKNVLCEKPLGLTVQEAQEMVSKCKECGVLLGSAFMMRFHSQHQAALDLIRKGKLGKLVLGRAQLSCWYPPIENAWRQNPEKAGGGSLMDLGCHCIDLLEMFFGRTQKVSCFINNSVHDYKSEDSAVATLFFENGAMGIVDAFFCIPDNSSKNMLEIYGSKGSIIATGTIGQGKVGQMKAFLQNDDAQYDARQNRADEEGLTIAPEPVNTYEAEIREFGQAIIENREPSNNAELGIRSQKVLSACYESARLNKIVDVE